MTIENSRPVGEVAQTTDDRLQCLALEYGLSREELIGWVIGIGATVLEVAQQIPDGKLVYFSDNNFRRISLPGDER